MPDEPAVGAEGSVQPSSVDSHPNNSSRLDRPRYTDNSGRRSICDLSRLVRPRSPDDSGRRSNDDFSRYDRPRVTNSTGRQCPDLLGEEGGNMDDEPNTSVSSRDNNDLHVVDVGDDEINTPRKNDSSLCGNANVISRESRPRVHSSGRQSNTTFAFENTRCEHRPLPDPGGGTRNHKLRQQIWILTIRTKPPWRVFPRLREL